jgi:hypothetical protein
MRLFAEEQECSAEEQSPANTALGAKRSRDDVRPRRRLRAKQRRLQ